MEPQYLDCGSDYTNLQNLPMEQNYRELYVYTHARAYTHTHTYETGETMSMDCTKANVLVFPHIVLQLYNMSPLGITASCIKRTGDLAVLCCAISCESIITSELKSQKRGERNHTYNPKCQGISNFSTQVPLLKYSKSRYQGRDRSIQEQLKQMLCCNKHRHFACLLNYCLHSITKKNVFQLFKKN